MQGTIILKRSLSVLSKAGLQAGDCVTHSKFSSQDKLLSALYMLAIPVARMVCLKKGYCPLAKILHKSNTVLETLLK